MGRILRRFFGSGDTAEGKDETASDIADDCAAYPTVGKYIVTTVEDLHSPAGTTDVKLVADVPYGNETWSCSRPYNWDTEEFLPDLAESFGYDENTFNRLVGEPVLVRNKDSTSTEVWTMSREAPTEYIIETIQEEDLCLDDLATERLRNLGVNIDRIKQETGDGTEDEQDVEQQPEDDHKRSLDDVYVEPSLDR